jgi:predicted nuclease with TOPRIM domain
MYRPHEKKQKTEKDDKTDVRPIVSDDESSPQQSVEAKPDQEESVAELKGMMLQFQKESDERLSKFQKKLKESDERLSKFQKESDERVSKLEKEQKESDERVSKLEHRFDAIIGAFEPVTKIALLESAVYQFVKLPDGVDVTDHR